MRLPQSIARSLSVPTIHFLTIGRMILLLGMVSVGASASTQQLMCTPANLRFGATAVGQTETLLVALTNTGQTSITISGLTVDNDQFTTSSLSLPLVLPAGQSVDLNVSFTPTALGWTGSTIKFSSGGSNPVLHLNVGGTGVSSEAVTASPSSVSFGQVGIGTSSTVPVVLTNTRSWKATLSTLQTTGIGFSVSGATFPLTLGAGQSVTLNVAFAPQSAGTVGGSFLVSGSGTTQTVPLTGTGSAPGQLTATPSSLAFGSVQVGNSVTLTDSLTNTGASSVTISQAAVTGTGFSINGLTFPLALNPGASVTFSVMFAPQSPVNGTGGITVTSNGSNPSLGVSLSGTGTAQGQLTIAPGALNFGNATVGTSVNQTSSLSVTGGSVTVSSASLSGNEFSLTGISLPMTMAAGQSVQVTLTFSPQTSGAASGVLSLASNASNNPTQNLSGVGVAPAAHSVALSWTDNGSGVVGYNVYRGGVSGGPYAKINSALDATPAYSDTSVAAGQTYYYVTTAVDQGGGESGYSNEAQSTVPSP
jgi:hypothetical protein